MCRHATDSLLESSQSGKSRPGGSNAPPAPPERDNPALVAPESETSRALATLMLVFLAAVLSSSRFYSFFYFSTLIRFFFCQTGSGFDAAPRAL